MASRVTMRTVRWTLIFLALWVPATPCRSAEPQASAYDPAAFTISYWCGPPGDQLTRERLQEVKAAGFTLAFPPCGGLSVEQNRRLLDLCQEVGLQVMIADGRMVHDLKGPGSRAALDAIVQDYADHPALLGYHVMDEPGAGAFDGLSDVAAYLRERDPRHPAYINLLPTYGRDFGALGTATYDEYVRTYAQKVRPFVISYDHYPFTRQGDRADFFENLATVRQVSLDAGIPFWNIVLVTQHFGYRHLTEGELKFQAMQTLAYGGRGLLWFTYWMPAGVPDPGSWRHSLIAADGTRDPHYEMVQRINAEAKSIGDALGTARSVEVSSPGDGAPPAGRPVAIKPLSDGTTIGVFEQGDRNMALVTNRDYRQRAAVSVKVFPPDAKAEVFDPADKTWTPIATDKAGVLTLDLLAGGGALLRW